MFESHCLSSVLFFSFLDKALRRIYLQSRVLKNNIYKSREQVAGHVACMERDINARKTFVHECEERRHFGKPKR